MINNSPPPPFFNLGLWIFPIKKVLPSDSPSNVSRSPKEARALTMKCTDNKASAAVVAGALSPVTRFTTHCSQNGFVPGRQLLNNVLVIDTVARINSLRDRASHPDSPFCGNIPPFAVASIAVTALFDFAAAFPSILHEWILLVLKSIDAPLGCITFVEHLYTDNIAYANTCGSLTYLFAVFGGVLQGCPLSSVLFNFSVDPLLFLFAQVICVPQRGVVQACADDIAAALRRLDSMLIMFRVFAIYQQVSGLSLSPSKCYLILDSFCCSHGNKLAVASWLATHIPQWADMMIVSSAKYLGLYLGPLAGTKNWVEPILKFKDRVAEIANSGDSAANNLNQYNKRAIPILAYSAQLLDPPPNINRIELASFTKILKLAPQSISAAATHTLRIEGKFPIVHLSAFLRASMLRAAHSTLSDISLWHGRWMEAQDGFLPLRFSGSPCHRYQELFYGWDSPPIVCNLFNALKLTNCSLPESRAISKDLEYTHSLAPPLNRVFQKDFYSILVKHVCSDWPALLERRLLTLLPRDKVKIQLASGNLFVSLDKCNLSAKVMVIRSVLNSWATSDRYHEQIPLGCVFGCNLLQHPVRCSVYYRDDLAHYLVCPLLWKIVFEELGDKSKCLPCVSPFPHPLELLCLRYSGCDPQPIIIAHHIYHSIRHQFSVSLPCLFLRQVWSIHSHASQIASAVVADIPS